MHPLVGLAAGPRLAMTVLALQTGDATAASPPAHEPASLTGSTATVTPAPAPTSAPAPTPSSATVVFAGDVVPHGDLLRSFERHGPASLLGPLAPVLRAADLALVNLETPVVPARPVARAGLRFNVHADFVEALAAAGVDGASIANNHSYDLGSAGVASTMRTLRGAGVRPIGGALAGQDPYAPERFDLAGGTLCVFAATRLVNYPWALPRERQARVALARSEPVAEQRRLLDAVRRHRDRCGAIVVSLHTGREYRDQPMPADRVFLRRVAEAGADAVIAHHSHTPQPVELHAAGRRQVPIFFSLGNLVSNQGNRADSGLPARQRGHWDLALDGRTREGLLAVLRFRPAEGGRLVLEEFGYVPLWTVNTRLQVTGRQPATISAALMPRGGGFDPVMQRRWTALLERVGAEHLLPPGSLPGGDEAYAASEQAVADGRRAAAEPVTSQGPVSQAPASPPP